MMQLQKYHIALAILLMSITLGQAAERPNFLLIIADDLCYRDLGFVGNKDVHSPNIDKLASEGLHLTNMYSPATTCSPTRHALYTGLYCVRAGAYPNHTQVYDGTKSIYTHLKEIGYRVALQNKSHVGPAPSFPYEFIKGADDLTKTKAFMTRKGDQPWMLTFASDDPHGGWTRGPRERYDETKITIPPYLHDNAFTRKILADYYAEISMLDSQVGKLMKLLDDTNQRENTVVVFISEQGSSFPYGGKWSLYDNGIRATTVIRWPGHIKPGSVNAALTQYVDIPPTFLALAGVDPTTIDTGCPDATGYRGFDGRNMASVWEGKTQTFRDYIYCQHTTVGMIGFKEPYPMRAVRDSRYKYIRNLAPNNRFEVSLLHKGRMIESWQKDAASDAKLATRVEWLFHRTEEELYDLDNDPYEVHNLASIPMHQETKTRLNKALNAWLIQQGDKGMETEMLAKTRQGKEDDGEGEDEKPKGKSKDKK